MSFSRKTSKHKLQLPVGKNMLCGKLDLVLAILSMGTEHTLINLLRP